jgi:hypothetical protein
MLKKLLILAFAGLLSSAHAAGTWQNAHDNSPASEGSCLLSLQRVQIVGK